MFKKPLKNIILAIIGLMLISACFTPKTASANSIIEFFVPSLKKEEYDPSKTLKAPFAVDGTLEDQTEIDVEKVREEKKEEFNNAIPLEKPHRLDNEIGQWLMLKVSEIITFDKVTYQDGLNASQKYFDRASFEELQQFFEEKKVRKAVESGQFNVRGFVQDIPVVLNAGPVNGSYRWLFNVPVMLSYMRKGSEDYRKAAPVNQRVELTIQVGRNPNSPNEHGLYIERWSGKVIED